MRKIIIKEWPYPEKTKVMLLRVENPIYDGNGNWHTNVIFRSINKDDKKVTLDWGLLPMLKTGQIFSDGAKLYDQKNKKIAVFSFDNVEFKFFVDQIMTEAGIVQRPAFRAKLGETYYNIPAIELVRSFFARTRRLAYTLLEANSILPLCQCQISTYPVKRVVVHLSPDCPADLASEKWISTLVWMATDTVAQKSWSSFFLYFKSCQGLDVFPKTEEEIPTFPLGGKFSLTCGYRSYGKSMWLDEIIKVDCDSIDFDEIAISKYITERGGGIKSKMISVRQSEKIEIVNSAQSALKRKVTADVDLPNLMFKKQPRISIIKKTVGMSVSGYNCIEKVDGSIAVTGKNDGFTDTQTGIEFSSIEKETISEKNDDINMLIPELKEIRQEDLGYNTTLQEYLETMQLLKRICGVVRVDTKIYEIPGESSFAWITKDAKRCCAVSMVKMTTGKVVYIIEADRTIYGSEKRWSIATLLFKIHKSDFAEIVTILARILNEEGHWASTLLKEISDISFVRLRHENNSSKYCWSNRIFNKCSQRS